jgi:TRAP-type mannitol/chloroaromatic compound transport system substrate-binding protein
MRVLIICLIVIILATGIGLTACTPKEEPSPTFKPSPSPAPAPEAEVYTLRLQTFAEPGTYFHDKTIPEGWLIPLETVSNGRIKIEHSGSGTIVPNAEMHTAVGKGVIDMCMTTNLFFQGTLPVTALEYGYPGQFENMRDMQQFLRLGFHDILVDAYTETFNVHYLFAIPDYRLDLISTKPFPRLSDIKGSKLRVGGALGKVFGEVGASAVMLPGSEIYTALSTGVIDGAGYGGMNDAESIGLTEVAEYAVLGVYKAKIVGDCMINEDLWNTLPQDIQLIIQQTTEHLASYGGLYNDWQNTLKTIEVREMGGTTYKWPKEDFDTMAEISIKLMDELATEEPRWAAPAVKIMKEIMEGR